VSDTLTYRGIACEAVFTVPPVAESLKLSYYYYCGQPDNSDLNICDVTGVWTLNLYTSPMYQRRHAEHRGSLWHSNVKVNED